MIATVASSFSYIINNQNSATFNFYIFVSGHSAAFAVSGSIKWCPKVIWRYSTLRHFRSLHVYGVNAGARRFAGGAGARICRSRILSQIWTIGALWLPCISVLIISGLLGASATCYAVPARWQVQDGTVQGFCIVIMRRNVCCIVIMRRNVAE
jgi:hypothetical protein